MKILISDKIHDDGINILVNNGFNVDKKFSIKPEVLQKKISDYDAIIIRSATKLNSDVLEKAIKLKAIGRAGVGLDNVDLEKAEELGIKVFNTPEAPSVSVAELTIGLILNLMRRISHADKTMHCGEWNKANYLGNTLKEKSIGLIGFGNIGREVAKKASALEMKVGIYDVDKEAKKLAESLDYHIFPSVDELIQNVDIVSLHIPSTVKTENTINQHRLELMKEETILINTARGNLVDEKALLQALYDKKIRGAALDVFREEPLKDRDLCNYEENLILTPHIGSQTKETQINASIEIAKKISNYLLEKNI